MSEPSDEFQRAQAELLEIGNDIRQLKANAKNNNDEQLSRQIQERVEELNKLKKQYKDVILEEIYHLESITDDEQSIIRIENLLPSVMAKQRQKERKRLLKKQQAHKEEKFNSQEGVHGIKCQRKIHSLLDHQGQGDTFCYFPRLNSAVPFSEGDDVYLTEKMDGTTMQATNDGIYKRFERSQKTKHWHGMSEEERYKVERVDLSNRSNQYIARAVQRYVPLFDNIPDGVCIYFEAIDSCIGTRFQNLEGFDSIFVFDSTRDGEFVPFGEAVELCQTLGLPCVAHSRTQLSLSSIIETLSQSNLYYTAVPNALLEGYVVRSTNTSDAAKIRVDDIPKIKKTLRPRHDNLTQKSHSADA